jgi:hypothetical protein
MDHEPEHIETLRCSNGTHSDPPLLQRNTFQTLRDQGRSNHRVCEAYAVCSARRVCEAMEGLGPGSFKSPWITSLRRCLVFMVFMIGGPTL